VLRARRARADDAAGYQENRTTSKFGLASALCWPRKVWTSEIRLRACRRIGEISLALEKAAVAGGRGGSSELRLPCGGKSKTDVLAEAGISKTSANDYERLRDLGIPPEWAPGITCGWYGRGDNALAERRAELRRVAKTEVDRRLKTAQAAIKRASVETQERIVVSGLSSEAARAMLAAMPTPQQLLPELDMEAVERIAPDRDRPSYDDDYEWPARS